MTNKKAIEWLKLELEKGVSWDDTSESTKNIREQAEVEIKEAFDMAIKALEQQEKSESEHDHEVVKAYNDGQAYILDKIRAEIEKESEVKTLQLHWGEAMGLNKAIDIIDKYRGE